MRQLAFLLLLAAACDMSAPTDAGLPDAACTNPKPECCQYCGGDVLRPPICANGEWSCPSGTVTKAQCPCFGDQFCLGPFSAGTCAACAGGTGVPMVCDVDAGSFECPPGTFAGDAAPPCSDAGAE